MKAIKSCKQYENDKLSDKKQHCSEYILNTLKASNQALYYEDFGKRFKYGTLRNAMSELVEMGKVLAIPKEWPKRFILREWANRPEYACVQINDKRGRAAKLDLLSCLKSLGWEAGLCVHNLKLSFMVGNLHWLGKGWEYIARNHSWSRLLELSYPVQVQCFDTGVVLVGIRCSSKPFTLDMTGLSSLLCLLGEVRNALRSECVPEPTSWIIVQWHLNRDTQLGGPDFYITFRDFFKQAAQIYYKDKLNKVRAEVSQSPRQTVQEALEEILNRDSIPRRGDT